MITATGRDVAVQARLCLRDLDSLMEVASRQRKPLHGDLRLGVIPTIAPFLLPGVLPRLRKAYPSLRLYLVEGQTQELHEQLLDGKLDVVLLALPYDLRGVEEMELFRDGFLIAYRKGTQRIDPKKLMPNRLHMESVILLQDGHCLRDHALDACRLRNSQRVNPFAASSLLTLVEMVDADLGVTFLPELAVGSSLLRNTRIEMQPAGEKSFRTIGLVWRRGSNNSDEFRKLGEFLRDNR
jgi:LysR family hydrogen peroxide-inducible transcriptional activator